MKIKKLLLLVVAIFLSGLLLAPSAFAALQRNADLQITIEGIYCTVDEVYDIVPSYIVNPEDCDKDEVIERINEELPTALPETPACGTEGGGECVTNEKPVDTIKDPEPLLQLNVTVLAVGLGLIAVIDQLVLDGIILRAVIKGGGRFITLFRSLFRL